MRVGLYYDFAVPAGSRAWDELRAQVKAADQLGFDAVWFSERHFVDDAPGQAQILLAHVSKLTQVVRIGGFKVTPVDHPIRVAEDFAVVDHLAGGRLNLGATVGDDRKLYRHRGVDWERRERTLWEGLDVVREAWTSDEFQHLGRDVRFPSHLEPRPKVPYRRRVHRGSYVPQWERGPEIPDFLAVTPKPLQEPHPPIWVLGTNDRLVRESGRRGFSCVLPGELGREALRREAKRFRSAQARSGRARSEGSLACIRDIAFPGGPETKHAIVGSPERIVARLKELQNEVDLNQLVWRVPHPAVEHDRLLEWMATFSSEVQPMLQA